MRGEAHNVLVVSISGKSSRRGRKSLVSEGNMGRIAGRSPEPLGNVA